MHKQSTILLILILHRQQCANILITDIHVPCNRYFSYQCASWHMLILILCQWSAYPSATYTALCRIHLIQINKGIVHLNRARPRHPTFSSNLTFTVIVQHRRASLCNPRLAFRRCTLRISAGLCYSDPGKKGKVIPLHAMEALGVRGGIAPTHS
jgi:hypothetical protein